MFYFLDADVEVAGDSPETLVKLEDGVLHTFPDCLKVTATPDDGKVMAVEHKQFPIYGVKFHPESIMTPCGKQMLENFINGGKNND